LICTDYFDFNEEGLYPIQHEHKPYCTDVDKFRHLVSVSHNNTTSVVAVYKATNKPHYALYLGAIEKVAGEGDVPYSSSVFVLFGDKKRPVITEVSDNILQSFHEGAKTCYYEFQLGFIIYDPEDKQRKKIIQDIKESNYMELVFGKISHEIPFKSKLLPKGVF
jgi:hypothetical protein